MTIASLVVEISANQIKLQQEISKTSGILGRMEGAVAGVGKALAGVFTVTAIAAAIKKVAAFGDRLSDLSVKTGISTTGLQRLDVAFRESGVTLETVTSATAKLARNLIEGDKSAVGALRKLGLSVEDLKRMQPDQQFITVADAIGKIPNPTERAYAAMTIFGKGGVELLAGLTGHLEETIAKFERLGVIVAEDVVRAAGDFSDQMDVLETVGMSFLAQVIGPLLSGFSLLTQWLARLANGSVALVRTITDWQGLKFLELKAGILEWTASIVEAGQRVPLLGRFLGPVNGSIEELRAAAQRTRDQVWLFSTSIDRTTSAATVAAPALIGLGKSTEDAEKAAKAAAKWWNEFAEHVQKSRTQTLEAQAALKNWGITWAEIVNMSKGFTWEGFVPSVDLVAGHARAELDRRDKIAATRIAISDLVATQGIYLSDVIAATRATEEHAKASKNAAGATSSFSQALKSIAVGKGFADLGSWFKGSINQIGTGIMEGFGNLISGGITSVINMGLGAIWKGIKSLFAGNAELKKVRALREEIVKTFGSVDEMRKAFERVGLSADRALNVRKVKDFQAAMEEYNQALKFQEETWAKVQAAIERYKFTTEELGPALQRQKLDTQAQQLYEDFMLLTGAGIETKTVLTRMADDINLFVQRSIGMGIAIPAAMRPMLEQMIDFGLLVDAGGKKITDLEDPSITFTETMSEGFTRVVEAIDRMVASIDRFLGITKDAASAVENFPSLPEPPSVPGEPEAAFAMQHGGLGRVTRPTLFLAGEAGPEDYAFSGAHRQFRRWAGLGDPALRQEVQLLRADLARRDLDLPRELARAVRDALQTAA